MMCSVVQAYHTDSAGEIGPATPCEGGSMEMGAVQET